MTPDAQQPEHCEHECVCVSITGIERTRKEPCDTSSGTRYKCLHDTRSRPHTPAPDNVWSADPKKGCEPCKNTECNYCAMRIENITQHDAATASAATLAERQRWFTDDELTHLRRRVHAEYMNTGKRCLTCRAILTKIKSLRQQEREQE
jgi:hypothetical protein